MRMTQTSAVDVFMALPPPHIIIKAEAQAGIYRDL
jgi:hypothetical protein